MRYKSAIMRHIERNRILAWVGIILAVGWIAACGPATSTQVLTHTVPLAISWPRATTLTAVQEVDLANRYLATMTLDQKIGQLMMVQFSGSQSYDADAQAIIQQVQPGAILLYAYQLTSAGQASAMISRAQHGSAIPLMVAADNEGGFIDNLRNIFPSPPSATQISWTNDPKYAYAVTQKYAQNMLSLGFNTDLAPDVDVQTVDGPDQSTRTFGTTPAQVVKLAGAALDAYQQNGIIATLKHFPGLGDATQDAHQKLPIITESRDQIEQIDLAPYRALLARSDQPGMIMSTDLLMPALDSYWPAELSPTIITGVLRNELHYNGVVLTDALYMDGVTHPTNPYFPGMDQLNAVVQALVAGCDMIMYGYDISSALASVQVVKDAIANGTLTVNRINQSVRRILLLKIARGLLGDAPNSIPGAPQPQYLHSPMLAGRDQ